MSTSRFDFEIGDRVGTITIVRPEKKNALDSIAWTELEELLRQVGTMDQSELRVVVLTGAGDTFCVGGDIGDFEELTSEAGRRQYLDQVFGVYQLLEQLPVPTIAAVRGPALGGGCELAIVCDLVVADETARFGTPEGGFGLIPGVATARGHTQLNARWIKYLVFTAEQLDADQAMVAGLVNAVVPEGEHLIESRRLAAGIASRAPLALRTAKELLNRRPEVSYDATGPAVVDLMGTQDHQEGITAFRQGRHPSFVGE